MTVNISSSAQSRICWIWEKKLSWLLWFFRVVFYSATRHPPTTTGPVEHYINQQIISAFFAPEKTPTGEPRQRISQLVQPFPGFSSREPGPSILQHFPEKCFPRWCWALPRTSHSWHFLLGYVSPSGLSPKVASSKGFTPKCDEPDRQPDAALLSGRVKWNSYRFSTFTFGEGGWVLDWHVLPNWAQNRVQVWGIPPR